MDDTQDKVRRNLVVFSAAIVLGWFLNLKLANITKLLVSADISSVNTGKLWIVALVVLIYLFLRYRFDNLTNSQILSLHDELQTQKKNYRFKYLLRKINQINRTGKFSPIFGTSLAESINSDKEEYEKEYSENVLFRLQISTPWSDKSPVASDKENDIWEGTVGISETYFKEGASRNLSVNSGKNHEFSIPLKGRIWIWIHSLIHVVSYSKSAVDFITPITLAFLAVAITFCKLIAIYLS